MTRELQKHRTFLRVATSLATLATCKRRQVGCVMVDHKFRILASGYNGTPAGAVNCTEVPCKGAGYPSGQGLEFCEALHAEQNALIQLKEPERVAYIYNTASPCMHCVKMLANTSAHTIVFAQEYPHYEARDYWLALGREWLHIKDIQEPV